MAEFDLSVETGVNMEAQTPTPPPFTAESNKEFVLEQLDKWAELPYDWDGHKALPTRPDSIDFLLHTFLPKLDWHWQRCCGLTSDARGCIHIWFHNPDSANQLHITIPCYNVVLILKTNPYTAFAPVSINMSTFRPTDIAGLFAQINKYLEHL